MTYDRDHTRDLMARGSRRDALCLDEVAQHGARAHDADLQRREGELQDVVDLLKGELLDGPGG